GLPNTYSAPRHDTERRASLYLWSVKTEALQSQSGSASCNFASDSDLEKTRLPPVIHSSPHCSEGNSRVVTRVRLARSIGVEHHRNIASNNRSRIRPDHRARRPELPCRLDCCSL